MGKKIHFILGLMFIIGAFFISCDPELKKESGEIKGRAFFENYDNNSGISIVVEKSDGLFTETASRMFSGDNSRVVSATVFADKDGNYSVKDLDAGLYSVTASSDDNKRKAVKTNVVVKAGEAVLVGNLTLTAVGTISGQITVDSQESGNYGFFVSVAGTSFLATTDYQGNFSIFDVPLGQNYAIIVIKGNFVDVLATDFSLASKIHSIAPRSFTSEQLRDSNNGLVWKGAHPSALSNPKINWAYYNTSDKVSYIYDGKIWQVLARDGEDGADGQDGQNGISIVWKGSSASHLLNPGINWAYYNTTDKTAYIYTGTQWMILAKDGSDGANGSDGQNGQDGQNGSDGSSIVWKGSLAVAPANPSLNWAYYNSVEKVSYIYDGSAWQVLARDGSDGANGSDGQNGQDGQNGADGVSIVWKGSSATALTTPERLWAYYNTTDKVSYIYDGYAWQVLARDGADGADGQDGQNGISIVWKGSSASHLSNPGINWAYYNTTEKTAYIYTGTQWMILSQDGSDGANGSDGQNGQDGQNGSDGSSIVWKGSLAVAPVNPALNWAYYNSVEKVSYIYDGSAWQVLARDGNDGANGSDGQNGADGVSIVWKGSSATALTNPERLWAYYNTTDKVSYIYDNDMWHILHQQLAFYAVLFDVNGGVRAGGGELVQVVRKGDSAVAPVVNKEGFTFMGWDIQFDDVSADISVKAIWGFSVLFNLEGGVRTGGGLLSQVVLPFTDAVVPLTQKIGYTFIEWDKSYTNVSSNLEISAVWSINKYSVSFDLNGGQHEGGGSLIQEVEHGSSAESPIVSKNSHNFLGWSSNISNITGNIIFKALWSDVQEFSTPEYVLKMITVPVPEGGIVFPVGTGDSKTSSVSSVYQVGETEVPYKLWRIVYGWATAIERGDKRYKFDNYGLMGCRGSSSSLMNEMHPVTLISWRDCIVWCNAFTEWYNDIAGSSLEPVYRRSGMILRDSTESKSYLTDYAEAGAFDGFRLPSYDEWELAARWRNNNINTVSGYSSPWFTKGDSASGASANYSDIDASGLVAWTRENSVYDKSPITSEVKKKLPNCLGIYDMSGNVAEFTFDLYESERIIVGGEIYHNTSCLPIGQFYTTSPSAIGYSSGFRLYRNL
ncbi:MAG: SUMF1/EgtB/PvdO family nonheme iron enzyme [Spirochaetales bacterium]|nr:SUMF1/EgtB/PvdO family nonheme iron enzyme [Spirochaetales bacterium]